MVHQRKPSLAFTYKRAAGSSFRDRLHPVTETSPGSFLSSRVCAWHPPTRGFSRRDGAYVPPKLPPDLPYPDAPRLVAKARAGRPYSEISAGVSALDRFHTLFRAVEGLANARSQKPFETAL